MTISATARPPAHPSGDKRFKMLDAAMRVLRLPNLRERVAKIHQRLDTGEPLRRSARSRRPITAHLPIRPVIGRIILVYHALSLSLPNPEDSLLGRFGLLGPPVKEPPQDVGGRPAGQTPLVSQREPFPGIAARIR